jgi:hypothetical protein
MADNETIKYIQFACRENIIQTDSNYVIIKEKTDGRPFNQTGNNVQISIQTAKDLLTPEIIGTPCLPGLRIMLTYDNKCNQIILHFDDVNFDCSKKLQKEKSKRDTNMTAFEKICYCADQMRRGKCEHQIGHMLFPNAYKTKVFLLVHPTGNEKPEKIELCALSDEQKAAFLDDIKTYTPINGLVADKCSLNVHYDSSIINASSFANAREYSPKCPKNNGNEIIIEIYPNSENPFCGVSTSHGCADCLKTRRCPSPLINGMIIEKLSPKAK